MTTKTKALFALLGIMTGFRQAKHKPFRMRMIWAFLSDASLIKAESITLNDRYLRIQTSGTVHDFRWDQQPLTDDEFDALKQVLILKLPDSMGFVTHADNAVSDHEIRTCVFMKTEF